jgi:hypothetical protein
MKDVATAWRSEVEAAVRLLGDIPGSEASRDRGQGRW